MSAPRNTIGHRLIGNAKWLDGVAKVFGSAVGGFYKLPGTRPIKNVLHGTWPLNHPLHPALTDATVGGYTAMVFLDVLYLITKEPALLRAADAVLVFSFATSLLSVISGLTDWNETYGEERRNGMLHGLVMVTATVLFIVSLWLRVGGGSREAAIVIGILGWLVMTFGAYIGGDQVFGYGTQVNRQAWSNTPTKWQQLEVAANGLEDRKPVVAKTKEGVAVFVAKVDGQVYAIANVCTHAGGPLNEGKWVGADRCEIECPWHASRFCVKDGGVVGGPATFGEPSFETRVTDKGFLEVRAR
ncbi:MAG TPA: Rieske 2Fe-2S domain-containing protein [Candidatus Limnocylindrales bacterium]|nr:Rieske 2Fe-2S domain-containing protein [Candidatus Limnocylindrales bacterium]